MSFLIQYRALPLVSHSQNQTVISFLLTFCRERQRSPWDQGTQLCGSILLTCLTENYPQTNKKTYVIISNFRHFLVARHCSKALAQLSLPRKDFTSQSFLTTLNPDKLQNLLSACLSTKTAPNRPVYAQIQIKVHFFFKIYF